MTEKSNLRQESSGDDRSLRGTAPWTARWARCGRSAPSFASDRPVVLLAAYSVGRSPQSMAPLLLYRVKTAPKQCLESRSKKWQVG